MSQLMTSAIIVPVLQSSCPSLQVSTSYRYLTGGHMWQVESTLQVGMCDRCVHRTGRSPVGSCYSTLQVSRCYKSYRWEGVAGTLQVSMSYRSACVTGEQVLQVGKCYRWAGVTGTLQVSTSYRSACVTGGKVLQVSRCYRYFTGEHVLQVDSCCSYLTGGQTTLNNC